MKAFMSWSGAKSHQIAIAFSEWIPCVIQAVEPWVSSKDIDRGSIWFSEIFNQLSQTDIGVVFVTRENQNKSWLLFESGALSKGLTENRVCTVLVDLSVRDIESNSPLHHLNHTTLEKDSILELVKTINNQQEDRKLKDATLERSFNALWGELEAKIHLVLNADPVTEEPQRKDEDVLNDILENVLTINKRLSQDKHRPESDRYITRTHAETLLKRLVKMDLERDDIEEIMEDITPSNWRQRQLRKYWGEDSEEKPLEN